MSTHLMHYCCLDCEDIGLSESEDEWLRVGPGAVVVTCVSVALRSEVAIGKGAYLSPRTDRDG